MSTDTQTNFLGIPVQGDITRGEERKDQRPREEFEPLVRALLDDPTIDSFGWTQYTPYFNDGDPCVFNATGIWVKTVEDVKEQAPGVCEVCQQPLPTPEDFITGDDDEDEEDEDEEDNEDGPYSLDYNENHPVGHAKRLYDHNTRSYHYDMTTYVGPDVRRYQRCMELDRAVEGGEFDNVLLDLFGDHCKVKVARNGITVTFYEHD